MTRFFWAIVLVSTFARPAISQTPLIRPDDRVALVGNTFADRMTEYGYFETLLHARLGEGKLVVRNFGWSADEPALMPRPLNFDPLEKLLAEAKADVVLLCFGMNESFGGEENLAKFEKDLAALCDSFRAKQFNGESPPRLILVSPIAHENLGGDLPDPAAHNAELALYIEAMKQLAAAKDIPFVDLFHPTKELMDELADGSLRLTINGIHLNAFGDWAVAQMMAEQLGLAAKSVELPSEGEGKPIASASIAVPPPPKGATITPSIRRRLPKVVVKGLKPGEHAVKIGGKTIVTAGADEFARGVPIASGPAADAAEKIRLAVVEKNEQFFLRWRAVNGEYIYGRRKEPFGVENFPDEMKKLDQIVREKDEQIGGMSRSAATPTIVVEPVQ